MAPQVQDAINLVCRSRIDPNKSAYESLEGPYYWNQYPLAPLDTKAVIYDDADTRASWAPHGLDEWLLGPSKDHYRCNLYYNPETKGHLVSGSANLFLQHCIVPAFTPVTHMQELSTKLQDTLATMGRKQRTLATLRTLAQHLDAYVSGTPPLPPVHQEPSAESQRVINIVKTTTSPGIQRVNDAPATQLANNPTLKRVLQAAPCFHQRTARANTPGALPNITPGANIPIVSSIVTPRRSNRVAIRNSRLIIQEAINQLLIEDLLPAGHFIPQKIESKAHKSCQLQTSCNAYDLPHHWRIHQQLLMPHERSGNCGDLDDSFWKGFWGHMSGRQQDGTKGHQRYVCHAPLQFPKYSQRQDHHVRMGSHQPPPPKGRSQLYSNHGRWESH